ncbi:MAG: histidine triad nucleotide-binding protein [Bacteroidota bacterium]|nr:histidine triad nucleotide-binding protein [Candidatus Kapabacteria bacterium]MDW8219706.1 histidine triad nucleotide-binding protein [Bacteroidota bacterium]
MESVFTKIIRRELPARIEYEDEEIIAIHDICPVAPVHILIIPKKLIPTVNDAADDDAVLLGKMILVAKKVAAQKGIAEQGYRLIINVGKDGGQTVFHLHMHLIGGKSLPFETA